MHTNSSLCPVLFIVSDITSYKIDIGLHNIMFTTVVDRTSFVLLFCALFDTARQ